MNRLENGHSWISESSESWKGFAVKACAFSQNFKIVIFVPFAKIGKMRRKIRKDRILKMCQIFCLTNLKFALFGLPIEQNKIFDDFLTIFGYIFFLFAAASLSANLSIFLYCSSRIGGTVFNTHDSSSYQKC